MLVENKPIVGTSAAAIVRTSAPSYAAYKILHLGFIALPIIAGLDKFFHFLVNWDLYLAPRIASLLPMSGHNFMLIVGGIDEIDARIRNVYDAVARDRHADIEHAGELLLAARQRGQRSPARPSVSRTCPARTTARRGGSRDRPASTTPAAPSPGTTRQTRGCR